VQVKGLVPFKFVRELKMKIIFQLLTVLILLSSCKKEEVEISVKNSFVSSGSTLKIQATFNSNVPAISGNVGVFEKTVFEL